MSKPTDETNEKTAKKRRADDDPRDIDERSAWHAERERLRRDRERTAWLLVDAEQRIASLLLKAPERIDEPPEVDLETQALLQIIENLRQEIRELRSSTSWRVTRPLRGLSGLLRNRKP